MSAATVFSDAGLTLPPTGSLDSLRFAVKDVFDVAGDVAGCGNPDWLRTHRPANTGMGANSRRLEGGCGPCQHDRFALIDAMPGTALGEAQ